MDIPDIPGWETNDRRVAHSCEAFTVYTETVRLADGTTTRIDYVDEPDSAVVLAFTPDEDVIVTAEYRHAVGRTAVGLPGGSVEAEDEDLGATAARELREEAGYRPGTLDSLLAAEPANGILSSTRQYFVATECTPTAPDRDSDESIQVHTVPFSVLQAAVHDGEIRDERTVTAVLAYGTTSGESGTDS